MVVTMMGPSLRLDGSRFLASLVAGSLGVLWLSVAYGGCTKNEETVTQQVSATVSVTTGGTNPCQFGEPDGVCAGGDIDTCDCEDCVLAPKCTGGCTDDSVCAYDPENPETAEDCSCDDCWQKVDACAPDTQGCIDDEDDPNACEIDEDCTCPDCTGTADCQGNCFDNGECVPAFENCDCADCAGQCGSGPGPTTTSSAGGMGGMGGTGGTAGMGGAPGVGGAGGTGGA
jgi:hypothetical protein